MKATTYKGAGAFAACAGFCWARAAWINVADTTPRITTIVTASVGRVRRMGFLLIFEVPSCFTRTPLRSQGNSSRAVRPPPASLPRRGQSALAIVLDRQNAWGIAFLIHTSRPDSH